MRSSGIAGTLKVLGMLFVPEGVSYRSTAIVRHRRYSMKHGVPHSQNPDKPFKDINRRGPVQADCPQSASG